MTTINLNTLLRELTALPTEVEWVEFKCNNQNPEEMGEYLSALANAAALLRDKVSDALSAAQKLNWIRNLLGFMSREDGTIRHEGPKRGGRWVLANATPEAGVSSQKTGGVSQDPKQEPPISS
jgi:hypothetical protein